MAGKESLIQDAPWTKHAGLTCVECPSCGFCFDEAHEDMTGGYTCPNCEVTRLYSALRRIVMHVSSDPRSPFPGLRALSEITAPVRDLHRVYPFSRTKLVTQEDVEREEDDAREAAQFSEDVWRLGL